MGGARLAIAGVLVVSGLGGCNAILGLGNPTVDDAAGQDGASPETGSRDGSMPGTDAPMPDTTTPDATTMDSPVDTGKDTGAGPPADSGGVEAEAASGDSGTVTDSGTEMDSGTVADSGTEMDSGTVSDSGTVGVDSGTVMDSATDSGPVTAPWAAPVSFGTAISGVWFGASADAGSPPASLKGVVTLGGVTETSGAIAGKIVGMTGAFTAGSVLHGGTSTMTGETLSFVGLTPCTYGLIAVSATDLLVASTDNGLTFTETSTGIAAAGDTQLMWMFQDTSKRWTAISTGGYLYQTAQATLPASSTSWSTVYVQSTYNFFFQPHSAPTDVGLWQSADGNTLLIGDYNLFTSTSPAYGALETTAAWGGSFSQVKLPVANTFGPNVLAFSSSTAASMGQDGIAVASTAESGTVPAYAAFTTNLGVSWAASTLPTAATKANALFTVNNAFLSPDGSHVWLLGQLGSAAAVYVSSNGGMTFADVSGSLPNAVGTENFVTGFAFDNTHIWIGSDTGDLLYSSSGGM